jgi:hypothetical protein
VVGGEKTKSASRQAAVAAMIGGDHVARAPRSAETRVLSFL